MAASDKDEQPLKEKELIKKKGDKKEKHIGKLIIKNLLSFFCLFQYLAFFNDFIGKECLEFL